MSIKDASIRFQRYPIYEEGRLGSYEYSCQLVGDFFFASPSFASSSVKTNSSDVRLYLHAMQVQSAPVGDVEARETRDAQTELVSHCQKCAFLQKLAGVFVSFPGTGTHFDSWTHSVMKMNEKTGRLSFSDFFRSLTFRPSVISPPTRRVAT
jgi:hypothetical protein